MKVKIYFLLSLYSEGLNCLHYQVLGFIHLRIQLDSVMFYVGQIKIKIFFYLFL